MATKHEVLRRIEGSDYRRVSCLLSSTSVNSGGLLSPVLNMPWPDFGPFCLGARPISRSHDENDPAETERKEDRLEENVFHLLNSHGLKAVMAIRKRDSIFGGHRILYLNVIW